MDLQSLITKSPVQEHMKMLPLRRGSRTIDSLGAKLKQAGNRRTSNKSFWISTWPLFVHSVMVLMLAGLLMGWVDGLIIDGNPRNPLQRHLQVSDVTTIISVLIKIQVLVAASWCNALVWRCTFMILRRTPLPKQSLSWMLSIKLPTHWRTLRSGTVLTVLLLMLPSTLLSPLITGAVDWKVDAIYKNAGLLDWSKAYRNDKTAWKKYLNFHKNPNSDKYRIRSIGIAVDMWQQQPSNREYRCRHTVKGAVTVDSRPMPPESEVLNATIPCLTVDTITWDQPPWSADVLELSLNTTKQNELSLAGGDLSWIAFANPGNILIYDPGKWNSFEKYCYNNGSCSRPKAKVFKGTEKVLLMLGFAGDGGKIVRNQTSFGNDTTFQPFLDMSDILVNSTNGNEDAVYLSGTLEMTAGQIRPPTSNFVSPGVIEAPGEYNIEPSIWAEEAFYHLPDLTVPMTIMNISSVPTWDNLEGYVKTVARMSYCSAWDLLYWQVGRTGSNANPLREKVEVLRATVEYWRLGVWVFCNLLLIVASVVMIWTQLSDNDRTTDGLVEALLMGATSDARKLKDGDGLDEEAMIGIQPDDEIEGRFEVYVKR